MIAVKYTLEGESPVFGMQTQPDGRLVAVDKFCKAHTYDLENAAWLDTCQLSEAQEHHIYERTFDVSNRYDIAVTADSNKKVAIFGRELSGWKRRDLQSFKARVYYTLFSHDAAALAIGCEDGRIFLYNPARKLSTRLLPPESDSISCCSFSDDDTLIAIGSFAKHVFLYDLQRRAVIRRVMVPHVPGQLLFTPDAQRLICIGQEPGICWLDTAEGTLQNTPLQLEERLSAAVLLGERHVLLGTRSDKMYLVDYESGAISAVITLPYIGVTRLRHDDATLFVSFVNGNIVAVALDAYAKELNMHLRINEFDKAAALIEENVLLLTQPAIRKFTKLWPVQFNKARALLLKGETEEALELVKPFFFDPEKQEAFNHYLQHQEQHRKLLFLIRHEKYAEAFSLVDTYAFLESTVEYAKLDEIWQKLFKNCQKLMMDNDPQSVQKAAALLNPYVAVRSKSNLVRSFLSAPTLFADAEKLLKDRDFRGYFALTQQHPFLVMTATYGKVLQIGNLTLQRLQTHEAKGEFGEAMEIARYLQDFLPMQKTLEPVIFRLEKKAAFAEAIRADHPKAVYDLAAKFEFLRHTTEFEQYHRNFLEAYRHAQQHADRAAPSAIIRELEAYLGIEYLKSAIVHLLKVAYLTELRYTAERRNPAVDWASSFARYVSCFGSDEELIALAERFGLSDALEVHAEGEAKPSGRFPPSMIVKN